MGILVCYDDFTYDVVSHALLEHLISAGSIIGFDRSADWTKRELTPLAASAPASRREKRFSLS